MSIGWVAGALRARAMAGHGFGPAGGRMLATGSWDDLVAALARSTYGPGLEAADPADRADRAGLRRQCTGIVIWNLRVLAGWLPSGSLAMVRALVGEFEIANIEAQLRSLAGGPDPDPIELGALGVAWPRVRLASSPEQLRDGLRFSSWGDPGASDVVSVAVGLRLSWARRLQRHVPGATAWALAAAAIVVARERFVFGREPNPVTAHEADRVLGPRWHGATSFDQFVASLPPGGRWAFADVAGPGDLWRAEHAWWVRVEDDAASMLDGAGATAQVVVGAVATMLVDLHRVRAAIETAGRGPAAVEVFDAVA